MPTIKATYQGSRHLKSPNANGGCWGVHQFWSPEDGLFDAPGVIDSSSLINDIQLELIGDWETSKWGRQFKFNRYSKTQPNGREGTIAFIRQVPGVGSKIAGDIYDRFGEDCIQMVIDKPEDVATVIRGFTSSMAGEASAILGEAFGEAKLKMPLVTLFSGIAFPRTLPNAIIGTALPEPIEIIKRNPFWLMRFKGVGFNRCDELRRKLKLPADMPERYDAAAKSAFDGRSDSVWVHKDQIITEVAKFLEIQPGDAKKVLYRLHKEGEIKNEGAYLALTTHYNDEVTVSRILAKSVQNNAIWPDMDDYMEQDGIEGLKPHQHEQVEKAFLNGRIAWLLGSPGTGKTFTALQVIQACRAKGMKIKACAPTGKAAQRLGQLTAKVGITPTTVHKLLGPMPTHDGWHFSVDGIAEMVDADLVIVDEVSMLDNWLATCLLRAIPDKCLILFVGDPNQLPPVGRGAMLRDWKEWVDKTGEGSYGELTEIQRNSGRIVTACAEIREGKPPQIKYVQDAGQTHDPNLQMAIAMKDEDMAKQLRMFVEAIKSGKVVNMRGRRYDPIKEIQFLVAVNKDSPVSREVVNEFLQKELNPRGRGDHQVFKVGDKIICTQNCHLKKYDPDTGKEEEGSANYFVANGELGVVTVSEKKKVVVKFTSYEQDQIELICPTGTGKSNFDLGFAITGHKSQGSEWPVVFTVLGRGFRASRVIGREWLYTCISRAQEISILCGSTAIVKDAVKKRRIWDRKSFFAKWMEETLDEGSRTGLDSSGGHQGAGALEVREPDNQEVEAGRASRVED